MMNINGDQFRYKNGVQRIKKVNGVTAAQHQELTPMSKSVALNEDVLNAKQQAVLTSSRRVPPDVDARSAFGVMPLELKDVSIRWRGL